MPYETLRLIWRPVAPMRKDERCMELLDLVGEWLEEHQRKDGQQPKL